MPSGLHRTYGAHHLHFITNSCYHRLPLLNAPSARDRFLAILEHTRQRYRFVVVGYVVMPEHIHLLITEPEVGTPLDGDAGSETAHGTRAFAQTKTQGSAPAPTLCRRTGPGFLAGALLRLQCLERQEAGGEAPLYASES